MSRDVTEPLGSYPTVSMVRSYGGWNRQFPVRGASALRISAADAAPARLGLLWTIIDDHGAALLPGSGVGRQKAALHTLNTVFN